MCVCVCFKKKKQQKSLGLSTEPQNSLNENLTRKNFKSRAEPQKFPESIKWYNYHESSYCLNTQKNLFINQAAPKKFLPKFSYPNESEIENFKPKKILWSSLSLEIRSAPPAPPIPHPGA